jgi:YVTN family beta-propeller protein
MLRLTEFLGMVVFFALAARFSDGQSAGSVAKGLLLVANKNDGTLGIIDPQSGRTLGAVAEGGVTGHEVIASPDGRFAYVPIYGNSGVGKAGSDGANLVVIDIAARKVTGNLDFGHGVRPHCPLFGPKDGLLYVTTELENAIAVIDPRTLKVVGAVPTGQKESHMLAITRDGRRGYTANVGPGTVSVLDLVARKTLAVIPISGQTQRISLSVDDRSNQAAACRHRHRGEQGQAMGLAAGFGLWNCRDRRRPLPAGGGSGGESSGRGGSRFHAGRTYPRCAARSAGSAHCAG